MPLNAQDYLFLILQTSGSSLSTIWGKRFNNQIGSWFLSSHGSKLHQISGKDGYIHSDWATVETVLCQ